MKRLGFSLLLLASMAGPLQADDRHDHEQARQAVAAGEVMPLRLLLQKLERTHPGEVLEVELEKSDGRWVYEVRLLQAGGVSKLWLDARDARLIRIRQPGRDGVREDH